MRLQTWKWGGRLVKEINFLSEIILLYEWVKRIFNYLSKKKSRKYFLVEWSQNGFCIFRKWDRFFSFFKLCLKQRKLLGKWTMHGQLNKGAREYLSILEMCLNWKEFYALKQVNGMWKRLIKDKMLAATMNKEQVADGHIIPKYILYYNFTSNIHI